MKPQISVIVLNYNGKKFLEPCLASLISQTFQDFEIILVDNGSTDGSTDFVRQHFPSVTILETGKNLGFAGGSNRGISCATGEFILTLNNDTIADPRFLEEIIKPVIRDSQIGMCAPRMLLPDGRMYSAGITIFRNGSAVDRGIFEPDSGLYDMEEEVFGPCAGAALYRRSMLDGIGLFDEDFFLYMEDVDLAFRARFYGWKCVYVPAARVVHFYGGTTGRESDLSVYYGNRNSLWCIIKNYPLRVLISTFPWILWRNIADLPFYFLRKQGRTIVRAKVDAIRGFPTMLKKRMKTVSRIPDREIARWIRN